MSLDVVFSNLSRWRPLPGYSVERRLDLLLSPYLPGFLSSRMGGAPVTLVTSEFPIPKRIAGGVPKDRLHVSADFLCLREGKSPAWILVELKTDAGSRRGPQDLAYLAVARREKPMTELLDALLAAKKGTDHAAAYARLVRDVRRRKVDSIEICYIEPISKARAVAEPAPEPPKVWSFGLGEFAGAFTAPDDPLWCALQKALRGIARSEKGRRTKDVRRSPR